MYCFFGDLCDLWPWGGLRVLVYLVCNLDYY
jgi:hypothetical protein